MNSECTVGQGFCPVHQADCEVHFYHMGDGHCTCVPCYFSPRPKSNVDTLKILECCLANSPAIAVERTAEWRTTSGKVAFTVGEYENGIFKCDHLSTAPTLKEAIQQFARKLFAGKGKAYQE